MSMRAATRAEITPERIAAFANLMREKLGSGDTDHARDLTLR
jgi:hypothetical protein